MQMQQIDQQEEASEDTDHGVVVPDIPSPLSTENLALLQRVVNPNSESLCFGRDVYLRTLQFVISE